jgi:hypothetical protein
MANKPVCKTCGLEVDEHFITLDDDGRAVAGRYGPNDTEWFCYSEIEIEKRIIEQEQTRVIKERERIIGIIRSSIAYYKCQEWPRQEDKIALPLLDTLIALINQ